MIMFDGKKYIYFLKTFLFHVVVLWEDNFSVMIYYLFYRDIHGELMSVTGLIRNISLNKPLGALVVEIKGEREMEIMLTLIGAYMNYVSLPRILF